MILEGAWEAEALDFSPAQPRSTERVAGSGKPEVYSPKYTEDFFWAQNKVDACPSFASVERAMSDRLLRQGFELCPSWAGMVNEGKQGKPISECGTVHVLPDEMA